MAGPCQVYGLCGCELSIIFGSLHTDVWDCVTLLVVWLEDFQCWNLQTVVWGQILVQKWGFPGKLISINILWPSAVGVIAFTVSNSQPPPLWDSKTHS